MRLAHLVHITPGRCGLYETAREIAAALRGTGIDARLVDPGGNPVFKKGFPKSDDRGVPVGTMEWAEQANVIISHSGYDGTPIEKTNQPIIHVAHGRPRSSFLSEVKGRAPVYSYHYRNNSNRRWLAVVTLWSAHIPYLKVMMPDRPICLVPPPVDLERWSENGPKYSYPKGINIVCADAWRDDVDPFLPLNAFALWARRNPAKLHLYAAPKDQRGYAALVQRIRDDGNMGEVKGWVSTGLDSIYRAADAVLTANVIDTRMVREAMACGCPVIRVGANLSESGVLFEQALSGDRAAVRAEAERRFNPQVTATEFRWILDRVND